MIIVNGKTINGIMLSADHVAMALRSGNFFESMPEFSELKDSFKASGNGSDSRSSFSVSISHDNANRFIEIASMLKEDRKKQLMDMMGIPIGMDVYANVKTLNGGMSLTKIFEPKEISANELSRIGITMNAAETSVVTKNHAASASSRKPGVMLGGSHITKAVSDANFFKLMPEFASIKAQIDTMHIDVKSKRGCNSCNKRRLHANIDGNFAAIASRLPDARAKVLKKYLGIDDDQPFFIRAMNPADRKLILRQF